MATTIETTTPWITYIGMTGVLLALSLFFVAVSQPYWRGDEMLAEMKANCAKVGGVMISTKGVFGTTYECAERKDQ